MLRTLVVTLALGTPGLAAAQQTPQFPESAVGIAVRGDDGTVLGRVDAVERDADGRIVAVEIAGLEPGSAPYASSDLVAEDGDQFWTVSDRRAQERTGGARTQTR